MLERNQANAPTFRVDLRQQRGFLLRSKNLPPARRRQHVPIRHNLPPSGVQTGVYGVHKD